MGGFESQIVRESWVDLRVMESWVDLRVRESWVDLSVRESGSHGWI